MILVGLAAMGAGWGVLASPIHSPTATCGNRCGHADALTQTRQWNPDLVLLDLGLPDGDGLEVLRRLRV